MANPAVAFLAGLGNGYVTAKRLNTADEEREEDRRMRQEEHDARMRELQRQEGDRAALADAARPVQVNTTGATVDLGDGQQHVYDDAGVANSDLRQARGMGLEQARANPALTVGGKAYGDRASAEAAAAAANTPEGTDARIAQALRERGNVVGAKQYEASSRQSQVSAMELADRKWNSRIRDALQNGHEGLANLVSNSQGGDLAQHKVKAVPSPDGTKVTYAKVNDDGSLTPMPQFTFTNDQDGVIRAAYLLDRGVTPETRYKNMVAEDKQAATVAAKEKELELRRRQLEEVQIPNAETRAQLAEVRAQLAQVRAGRGSDGVSREERLRYTTLFTDAGRRMQDAQKALNTMRMDRSFMREAQKPGTPQAQQLADLQQQLRSHTEERELYRGLLASGSGKGAKEGGLADAEPHNGATKPTAQPGSPVKITTKAERDKLPKGTRYIGPDGQTYIKQ